MCKKDIAEDSVGNLISGSEHGRSRRRETVTRRDAPGTVARIGPGGVRGEPARGRAVGELGRGVFEGDVECRVSAEDVSDEREEQRDEDVWAVWDEQSRSRRCQREEEHAAAGGRTLRLPGMGDGGDESGQHAESRLRLRRASDSNSAGGTRLSAMATWTERAKMLTGRRRREDAVSRAAGACAAFPRGEGGIRNGARAAGRWARRKGELPFSSWNCEVLKYGYDMTEGGTVASAMLSERRVAA